MSFAISRPKSLFGYDVVGPLSEGNAHHLYVVCDSKSGQLFALKHVVKKSEKDVELIDQLQAEFDVSKPFRSPFLRKCVDLKVNKKLLGGASEAALVMELVDGESLESLPQKSAAELIGVFMQIARGLATLHNLRFVHGEVKPHHILVSSEGTAKLIDFSHVCKVGTLQPRSMGMSEFIAPEQVRCKGITQQTDIYNLGATMYWALTRHRVPSFLTVKEADWHLMIEQPYPTPAALNPEVPEPLSKLVMWCCQVNVGSRPADMNMVVGGLEKVSQAVEASKAAIAALVPAPESVEAAPPRRRRPGGVVSHPLDG